MEELRPGGSCGVHSWIEGAGGDGRRVSWFAPQNQAGLGTGRGTGVDGVEGLVVGEEVTGVG